MAAGSSEPLAKPSAARVTQGRNRQSRRRTPQEPDSPRRALRLHPINSSSQYRLMVVAQGRASCLAPHLFAVEARPGRRLAARTWIRAPPRLPRHAQSDLPSWLRGESASWAHGRIRSLSQSFDGGGGPVAFPLDPLPPGRKEETPPRWRGSRISACAMDYIDAAIAASSELASNLTRLSQMAQPQSCHAGGRCPLSVINHVIASARRFLWFSSKSRRSSKRF